ncbi:hypothetical protein [Clostridium saccharoperbutylacetonicum]|uniref:hypothetical protein n=1 Tax=Clostridium saccharoperbutylacetonicum TaxID=36745 RepID=UPI0039EAD8A3
MLVNLIIVVIGLLIIFGTLSLIIDLIVGRITKDLRKQNIIGNFIIMLICLIFIFILLTVKPVLDCIKYKKCKKLKEID